jgi:membrane protein YdbS with pleckstrin-like domain
MSKYVAPVLSALVVIVLAAGYALFFFLVLQDAQVEQVVMVIIAAVSAFVVIGVGAALILRIRELKGGQEDDLGKY